MRLLQKQQKGLKIKNIFESNLVLVFHHNGFTVNEQNKLKNLLNTFNLKSFVSNQTVAKKALGETKFKNVSLLLDGPIMFIYGDFKGNFTDFSKLCKNIHKNLDLLSVKKDDEFYDRENIFKILQDGKGFHFNTDSKLEIGSFRAFSHILKKPNTDLIKLLNFKLEQNN